MIHAALDAADATFTTIVNATSDHDARNAQMVAWLLARPEFAAAGATDDDSVWGQLVNGHLYIATSAFIAGETAPPQKPASERTLPPVEPRLARAQSVRAAPAQAPVRLTAQAAEAAALSLPSGAQARVLLSLDSGFFDPPNAKIAALLRDRKYTVIQQAATIENLKNVQGDSAFYWGSHGAIGFDAASQKTYWAVWTADDVTDARNTTYKGDLDDHSLVYFAAAYKEAEPPSTALLIKTRYAITTNFIAKYNWSFADHAFLFMNSCHSDNGAIVVDMANMSDHPGATFGWSGAVRVASAWKAGLFAFDRLLGSNQSAPLEPVPQRPFDSTEVYFDMKDRGLDLGGDATRLKVRTAVGIALAPSIQRMELAERIQESPLRGKTKLTLHGIFGADQGTVKVGGVEVPIDTWKTDQIECEPADLPGPGFAGDVQVISHDRTSNQVPLTQWHGTVKYSVLPLPPESTSTAVSHIDCDVYFRGDVHKYRENAGRAVVAPKPAPFRASQGSTCHWHVDGDPVVMAVWSKPTSSDLPFGLNGTVNAPYGDGYIFSGVLDPANATASFSFNYLGCVTAYRFPAAPTVPPQDLTTIHDQFLTSQGSNVGADGYVVYANNLSGSIGEDLVIPGASPAPSSTVFSPKLEWSDFIPNFPPDDSKGEDDGAP